MFDSVLERNIPPRRLGRGALMSFAVHAALLALALYISSRPKSDRNEKLRTVTFFSPPPPPPPPPAGGGAQVRKPEPKKVIKKPDTVVQTKAKIEKPPETKPDPEPNPEPGGVAGGVPGGVPGGVVGGVPGGVVGGTGTEVIPFGAGMERPTLMAKPSLTYSKEAMAMKVGGLALAKCIINLDGSLTQCKITKSLPYMDQQILESLRSWKYTPVMYQGHPQRVEMIVQIRVPAPA
jgi:periplasmic protein TonB